MATSSTTVDTSSFTTDAKFRTWGSALSAALLASGLTQTADTGQINWTTVTRPTTANTKAGYEIWRFNDALQASAPIFFRIDYGSGGNASGQIPSTWLTVGTGSDGAGNITGVGMVVTQTSSTSTSPSTNTTTTVGAAYSTSAGACSILAGIKVIGSTHAGLWTIARTCSSTGVTDGNGVTVNNMASATPTARGATFSPANALAATKVGIGALSGNTSASTGSVIQLYRQYAVLGPLFPTLGSIGFVSGDAPFLSTIVAAPFGSTTHTYLAFSSTELAQFECSQSFGSFTGALIWE